MKDWWPSLAHEWRLIRAVAGIALFGILSLESTAQLVPPIITVHPQSQTVGVGADVTFSVTVTNTATLPLTNWLRKAGRTLATNIIQDYSTSFQLRNVQTNDAGIYTIGVLNAAGNRLSSNAVLTVSRLFSATATLVAESCMPGNGVPDPGEVVTFEFALANTNAPATSNLVATLEAGNGIHVPREPQTYDGLFHGGPPVARQFAFVADAACGSNIVASLRLWDGTNDLGRVKFNFRVGLTNGECCYDAASADVVLTMTGSLNVSGVEYQLTLTNRGPGTATGIRLINPAQPGLQIVSATSPSGACVISGDGVVCDLADLARDAGTSVTVLANLSGPQGLSVTNIASVGAAQRDDNPANNLATIVMTPPLITAQPQSQTVLALTNIAFRVVASGSGPFSYQWRKDGTNLIDDNRVFGAQTATLTISRVLPADAANYSVEVRNALGVVTGAEAVLMVVPLVAWGNNASGELKIPLSLTNVVVVAAGSSYSLALKADGTVVAWGSQTNVPLGLSNVMAISVGTVGSHNLALRSNGTVVAWGSNLSGQTNVPPNLSNAVAIAAGWSHSLALRHDGTVVAWGANYTGQTNVPRGLSNVVAIAAGAEHNLVLKADGRLVAWGANFSGLTNVPTGLSDVIAIAAGSSLNLALKANGTVVAWGYNGSGATNVPAGLSSVVAIAAGNTHSLALKADGKIVAWGSGSAMNFPIGLPDIKAISASASHSLALLGTVTNSVPTDNTNWVWRTGGDAPWFDQGTVTHDGMSAAQSGRIADNQQSWIETTVIGQGTLSFWWKVSSEPGYDFLRVAIDGTSQLAIDGEQGWQQASISIPSGTHTVRWTYTKDWSVSVGQDAAWVDEVRFVPGIVVIDSSIAEAVDALEWPWSTYGDGRWFAQSEVTHDGMDAAQTPTIGFDMEATLETSVTGPGILTFWWKMAPGLEDDEDELIFAIDGSFRGGIYPQCWPCDWQRRAYVVPEGAHNLRWVYWRDRGRGAWLDQVNFAGGPVLPPNLVPWGDWYPWYIDPIISLAGLTNIVALAAGGAHSVVLRSDGTVAAWGADDEGQVNVPPNLRNVAAVAAGRMHCLALKDDGTVIGWGAGDGTNGWPYDNGQSIPPSGLSNVVAIAAGGFYSLALKSDGTVVSWGMLFDLENYTPAGLTNVVAVAVGDGHALALKGDSTVAAWGYGFYGQTNVPPVLVDAVAIAAGRNHNLALKADGTVVAWGSQTNVPRDLSNVVAIAAGGDHSLALKSDGTVAAWGWNYYWDNSGPTNVPPGLSNVMAIAAGDIQSLALVRTTNGPPMLRDQPDTRIEFAGRTTHFNALADGTLPLRYQWRRNGADIPGATNSILTLSDVNSEDDGTYSVVVSNAFGLVTSHGTSLTVVSKTPFVIAEPSNRVGFLHGYVTMDVAASGSPPIRYQWRSNGVEMVGATNSTLRLGPLRYADAGTYSAVASNPFGSVSSSDAVVSVVPVAVLASFYFPEYQDRVPPNLTNVLAISGNNLALRTDGTIAMWDVWGGNDSLAGVTDAIAIAAGGTPLALRADGTIVNGPSELSNVVAIATGRSHSLALRADGTVAAWGSPYEYLGGDGGGYVPTGATDVPADLSDVVAVAAGYHRSLALKKDGTVVGWPTGNIFGFGWPTNFAPSIPFLSNVVAVTVGDYWYDSFALKNDGTVIGWGRGINGETRSYMTTGWSNVVAITSARALNSDGFVLDLSGNIVVGLTNVVAITDGLALIDDNRSARSVSRGLPVLTIEPASRSVLVGDSAFLVVMAVGAGQLRFQWKRDGVIVPGETNHVLNFASAREDQEGVYSVIVTNALGAVTSRVARLVVLVPPRLQPLPGQVLAAVGEDVTLAANATGTPPLRYQWRKNGANIPGATNATFTITNAQISDGGSYSVVVANDVGVAVSEPTLLVVAVPMPVADHFADRVGITGLTNSISGTNRFATREEPDEPKHAGKRGGKSVWYSWLAPTNGIATFRTVGSTFDTLLGIYTNDFSLNPQPSVSNLVVVASDEDRGGFYTSLARFNAVAGTEYYFAIDGFAGADGHFVLGWELEPTAETIPVLTNQPAGQVVTNSADVTFTVAAAGAGLTYQWLFNGAAIAGATTASLTLSNVQSADVGFYSVRVRNSFGREAESLPATLELGAQAGQSLSEDKLEDLFTGEGAGGGGGGFLAAAVSPFLVSLGSIDYRVVNNTSSATQQREPVHCLTIGNATRWLLLRPAADGTFVIDTHGSVETNGNAMATVLAVYGGSALSPAQVACDDDGTADGSRVRFSGARDREYFVMADGAEYAKGLIQLNWRFGVPPAEPLVRFAREQLRPGGSVLLRAPSTNGIPPPRFQWHWNGRRLAGQTNAWLWLEQLVNTNGGFYTVEIDNGIGAVSHTTQLDVEEPILLTVEPQLSQGTLRLHLPAMTNAPVGPGTEFSLGMVIETTSDIGDALSWRPVYLHTNQASAMTWAAPTTNTLQFYRARRWP